MQELLEEVERFPVLEHAEGDPLSVRGAVVAEDLLPQPLDESLLHVGVVREQVVDDLVARDGRGPMPAKARERGRLSGADASGDRDRDRVQRLYAVSSSGSAAVSAAGSSACSATGSSAGASACTSTSATASGSDDVSASGASSAATSASGTPSAATSASGAASASASASISGMSVDSASSATAAPPVGNASSERIRSGVSWTDSAPSARGTGCSPSSTRFSDSDSLRRSPS